MKKTTLDIDHLNVETFDPRPDVSATLAREGRGTACWELCAADPTSNPDEATCGAAVCEA
jgi:hypothetical protein